MPAIRRIVCPVDFSGPSDHAYAYAIDLARRAHARIDLVHVYQLPTYTMPDGALFYGPEVMARITSQISGLLTEAAKRAEGVEVETHLVEGAAHSEITRVAKDLEADLIVMGTQGRTGLKHLLLGSVAERVVRTATMPVLTVPSAAS